MMSIAIRSAGVVLTAIFAGMPSSRAISSPPRIELMITMPSRFKPSNTPSIYINPASWMTR